MGRLSPRGLNNETHWNFKPKQLKPNHTIYNYKIFTYIAKKSRRGGIILMSGVSIVQTIDGLLEL
jgi:hypothetical protein